MMQTSLTEPRARRWTRGEYYQMGELGWFHDRRVELVDGEIGEMTPQGNIHAVGNGKADDALRQIFGSDYWIRIQLPLAVSDMSEPEPDLAVVPGRPGDYSVHPDTALLVVEVSDTTLDYDRQQKAGVYARAGVADFWIVNQIDRQLEVFRNPVADPQAAFGARYADRSVFKQSDRIAPLSAPQSPINVADLL